jgi:hypothetical protein
VKRYTFLGALLILVCAFISPDTMRGTDLGTAGLFYGGTNPNTNYYTMNALIANGYPWVSFLDGSTQTTALPTPQNYYLSSHHEGTPQQNLYVSASSDGINWKDIVQQPLYTATGGEYINSPVMTFWNGYAIFAWLNQVTAPTSSFGFLVCQGGLDPTSSSPACTYADVSVSIPGATANEVIWSPYWLIDSSYNLHLFLAISPDCKPTAGACSSNAEGMNIWEIHPTNPTAIPTSWTWSTPVEVTGTNIPVSSGTTPGIFNEAVVQVGSKYNLFYNNANNSYYVEGGTSSALLTNYTVTTRTGNWAGWMTSGTTQGVNLVHVGPNHWRMYADYNTDNAEVYSDCASENWDTCTWSAVAQIGRNDGRVEHQGTYQIFPPSAANQFVTQLLAAHAVTDSNGVAYFNIGNIAVGNTYNGSTGWTGNRTAMFMNDGTTEAFSQIVNGLYVGTLNSEPLNLSTNNVVRLSFAAGGAATLNTTLTAANLSTSGTIAGALCATSGGLILYESGATGCTISREDLKLNISPLMQASAFHDIMALEPIAFNFKDPKVPGRRYGFGAFQVHGVNPVLSTFDGKGAVQAYDPNAILAELVVMVKAQQREIEALKARRH